MSTMALYRGADIWYTPLETKGRKIGIYGLVQVFGRPFLTGYTEHNDLFGLGNNNGKKRGFCGGPGGRYRI